MGFFRRLFGKDDGEKGKEEAAAHRAALLGTLPEEEAGRVSRLEDRKRYILQLAAENTNLAGELLQDELDKLDDMVTSFVDVASTCARWERHLKSVDWDELETDSRKHQQDAKKAIDPETRALAKRNLEVLDRRRDQLVDLKKKVAHARSQLDLIESTFKMLGNQVLLMQSPKELGAQLDDLRVGIEAVREMTTGDGEPERSR